MKRVALGILLLIASALAFGQEGPQAGSHLASQAAADVMRDFAGADGAFLPGDLIKDSYQKEDLATLIQPPNGTDNIVVLSLSGDEIRRALERSVSLYPQRNPSFLQIAGFEAAFNKNNAPGQRIVSITVNGSKLEEKRTYTVAMPASLGRGGLGYFKIWDSSKIAKTFDKATVESVLRGKRYNETSPRWSVVG